jgi:hypothetical protein
MDTTVAAGAGHPVVATLLGLGAAALAALVVVMAWSVHVRQFRLAEQLARRQFTVTAEPAAGETAGGEGEAAGQSTAQQSTAQQSTARELTSREPAGRQVDAAGDLSGQANRARASNGTARSSNGKAAPTVIIDGPETVTTGEQARYRLRPAGIGTVVSWAVGGGSVSQAPDPGHPDELLMIADRPGDLTVIARAREGMVERRATKAVTAVPEDTPPAPPVTLRLFLHSWGLLTAAVLVVGFAGALVALGSLSSSDFIALVVPLTALLGMVAVGRSGGEGTHRPGRGTSRPPF